MTTDYAERNFQVFMRQVDASLNSMCGLDSADLPDIDYRSLFEDEYEPKEVARIAYKNARDDDGLDGFEADEYGDAFA